MIYIHLFFQVLRIGMSTHRTLPTDKNWSRKRGRRMTSAMKSSKRTHQRLDRWNSAAKLAVARALFPKLSPVPVKFVRQIIWPSDTCRGMTWASMGGWGWLWVAHPPAEGCGMCGCSGRASITESGANSHSALCRLVPLGPAWCSGGNPHEACSSMINCWRPTSQGRRHPLMGWGTS